MEGLKVAGWVLLGVASIGAVVGGLGLIFWAYAFWREILLLLKKAFNK